MALHVQTITARGVAQSANAMLSDLTYSYRISSADLPNEQVIFGSTLAMQRVHEKVDSAARNDLPLIIEGESGTGKEIIAKYLHTRSNRPDAPFVKVSCAIFPTASLETELLGDDGRLLPRPENAKSGLIESAEGGTLFLDEIGDMDRVLQLRLLGLLQSRVAGHIGKAEQRLSRVRVVCAANVTGGCQGSRNSLGLDPSWGNRVMGVHLSTLRERQQDIPQLCGYLMQEQSRRFGKGAQELLPATLEILKQWRWPGNLRELENWIARVVILGNQETLRAELGRQLVPMGSQDDVRTSASKPEPVQQASVVVEARSGALKTLRENGWSRPTMNEELEKSYRAVLYRLRGTNTPRRRRRHREIPPG